MKPIAIVAILLLTGGVHSCRIVETGTLPVTVKLRIAAPGKDLAVFISKGAGRFEELKGTAGARHEIRIPRMDGGYKEILFIRYQVHDPKTYGIIQLRRRDAVVRELSLNDIEALPRDSDGYSIVNP